jgi:hypothetical protein
MRTSIKVCAPLMITFLVPLLGFGQQPSTAPAPKRNLIGYVAEFTATIAAGSEEPRIVYRERRWISSSGNWRSVQERTDGQSVERFSDLGGGVYQVDEKGKKLVRLGSAPGDSPTGSATASAEASKYIRTETLLGFDTDIYEIEIPGGSALLYRARQLNGDIIKVMRRSAKNTFTLEATRILLGEPDPELLKHPEYPVAERLQRPP